jgi:hypothetical protein
MKLMKMFFAMACVVGVVGSGFGQGLQTKTPGTLGYLDPETGTFRILPTRSNSAETPATVSSGKFVVSFTITVSSAIAASAKIACIANATVVETSIAFETIETADVIATRSGSTATCTVNIPYSWNLENPSDDQVILSYEISAPAEAAATASFPQRMAQGWIANIPVPANGATTNETVMATF